MGQACVFILLVTRSNAIEQIYIYHLRIIGGHMQHAQPVGECGFIQLYH